MYRSTSCLLLAVLHGCGGDKPDSATDGDPTTTTPSGAASGTASGTPVGTASGTTDCVDGDGDGFTDCDDCDDADATVFPGQVESCNGRDDDCDGVLDLDATGVGVCSSEFGPTPEVDVLLMIDNSCSMFEEQAALADVGATLANLLSSGGGDFHLGVITADPSAGGRLRQAQGFLWVDRNTSDPEGVANDLVQAGITGPPAEYALQNLHDAIEVHAAPGGANDGFYRASAPLEILLISDGDDDSPNMSPVDFAGWLNALKLGGVEAVFSYVVTGPSGCPTSQEVGRRYLEVGTNTLGYSADICGTWDRAYDSIRRHNPEGLRDFWLPVVVEPDSLAAEITDLNGGYVASYGAADLVWDAQAQTVRIPVRLPPATRLVVWYREL